MITMKRFQVHRRKGPDNGYWDLEEDELKEWIENGKLQPMDEVYDWKKRESQYTKHIKLSDIDMPDENNNMIIESQRRSGGAKVSSLDISQLNLYMSVYLLDIAAKSLITLLCTEPTIANRFNFSVPNKEDIEKIFNVSAKEFKSYFKDLFERADFKKIWWVLTTYYLMIVFGLYRANNLNDVDILSLTGIVTLECEMPKKYYESCFDSYNIDTDNIESNWKVIATHISEILNLPTGNNEEEIFPSLEPLMASFSSTLISRFQKKLEQAMFFKPKWLKLVQAGCQPSSDDKIRKLEELRKRFDIPYELFAMRITGSIESIRPLQYHLLKKLKLQKSQAPERELWQEIVEGRIASLIIIGSEVPGDNEIAALIKNAGSFDEICDFIVSFYSVDDEGPDPLGIGKMVDDILAGA